LAQTTGTIRPLVILVRFQDHANRTLPSLDDINELFHGTTTSDLIPTGSIQSYLLQNSYSRFVLEADIMDWTLTDQTEAFYSYSQSGLVLSTAQSMHVVLDYWESQGVDMAQYDQDGDGVMDAVIMLHSGYPAEVGGVDCQTQTSAQQRIWSHAIDHTTAYSWQSSTSNIQSGPYVIGSAMRGTCNSDINRIGVLTHEFIHLYGIPDLYDISGDWIGKGVGSYDIMGNPYGMADPTLPSNVGPWTKLQMQWVEPIVIEEDGLYTIQPSGLYPQIYKISAGFPSSNEFLLIENRQPIQWDASFTGGGLVIWHIDDAAPGQRRRGDPSQEGWPLNGNHYQVAVLQADTRYDLETGSNQGDADDFYVSGKELGPAPIEDGSVTPAFHPSTNSYYNGQVKQTGIRIYNISLSATTMTFRVSGVSPVTDTSSPSPTLATTPSSTTMGPIVAPASSQIPTPLSQTVSPSPAVPPPTVAPELAPTPVPTPPPTFTPILQKTPPPTPEPIPGQTPLPTPPPVMFQTQIPVATGEQEPTESATLAPTTGDATTIPATPAPTLSTTLGQTGATTTAVPTRIAATTAPILTTLAPAASATPPAPILTGAPTETPSSNLNEANTMTLSDSCASPFKMSTLFTAIALVLII
jgi:immune inhibitor A